MTMKFAVFNDGNLYPLRITNQTMKSGSLIQVVHISGLGKVRVLDATSSVVDVGEFVELPSGVRALRALNPETPVNVAGIVIKIPAPPIFTIGGEYEIIASEPELRSFFVRMFPNDVTAIIDDCSHVKDIIIFDGQEIFLTTPDQALIDPKVERHLRKVNKLLETYSS